MKLSLMTFIMGALSLSVGCLNLFIIKGNFVNDYIGIFNLAAGTFMVCLSFSEVKP